LTRGFALSDPVLRPRDGTAAELELDLEYDIPATAPRSPWADAWRRLKANRLALASSGFVLLVTLVALLAPFVARHPHTLMAFEPLAGPTAENWMGTDNLGRDLWSRVVHGARTSLIVGLGSQAIAVTIGLTVGTIAGFFGTIVETLLMRMTDLMLALPSLLLALLFLTVLGASTGVLVLAIGLATWPVIARVSRAQVLQARELPYVEAAFALGASPLRVLGVHVVRNILGPVIVLATFGIPQAIFTEAFLSFIGLGPAPPTPSWGRLLSDSFQYVQVSPHFVLFPSLALTLTLLAFNFLGDGVRDAFDPHQAR
jgi:ABC-type dipeptide/oligopeptide/nickel transport system permease subunit